MKIKDFFKKNFEYAIAVISLSISILFYAHYQTSIWLAFVGTFLVILILITILKFMK